MDSKLEEKVKGCSSCQANQKFPAAAPLHPCEWPEQLWTQLHADFTGLYLGKMFLVVVDSHLKWMEVQVVSSATSQITTEKLP